MTKKGIIVLGVGAIIVLGVIGALSNGGNDTQTSSTTSEFTAASKTTESPSKAEPSFYGIGEKATQGNVSISMLSVSEVKSSNQFIVPESGKVFLSCEFEIENNSNSDVTVSSIMSFTAYVDGYSTNLDFSAITAASDKSQLDGTVAPGKKMKGIVAYQVPKNWKELEINFKNNVFINKDIKFKYTK